MRNVPPVIWFSRIIRPIRTSQAIETFAAKVVLAARSLRQARAARKQTWENCDEAARLLFEGLFQGFHSFPPRPVAVPLGANFYQRDALYLMPYSRELMRLMIDAALEVGLIRCEAGVRPQGGQRGTVTTIWPSGKLLLWLEESDAEWLHLEAPDANRLIRMSDSVTNQPRRAVRDSEGRLIPGMRRNLVRINGFLSKQCIGLNLSDQALRTMALTGRNRDHDEGEIGVNFFQTQLYRVFAQGDLSKGGRFYGGWWQGVRSELRRRILINGSLTVELDFDSLALHMLYAREGLMPPQGDGYDLSFGYANKLDPRRSIVKRFVIATINDQEGHYGVSKAEQQILGVDNIELKRRLAVKHAPIAKYFGTGVGVELQCEDSQIAERVMLELLDLGETCLPIHDSFIVRRGVEQELEQAMMSAYSSVMGQSITSSRTLEYEGPAIEMPAEHLLDAVSPGAVQEQILGVINQHLIDYSFLRNWLSSWEMAMLPEAARVHDVLPINHRLLRRRLARAGQHKR